MCFHVSCCLHEAKVNLIYSSAPVGVVVQLTVYGSPRGTGRKTVKSVISLLSPQDMTAVLAHGPSGRRLKAELASFLPEEAGIGALILSISMPCCGKTKGLFYSSTSHCFKGIFEDLVLQRHIECKSLKVICGFRPK